MGSDRVPRRFASLFPPDHQRKAYDQPVARRRFEAVSAVVQTGLAVFAVVWTLTEATTFFIGGGDTRPSPWLLGAMAAICLIVGWVMSAPIREGTLRWHGLSIEVVVSRGDLFEFDGPIAVAANDIFDIERGVGRVDPLSLHGIVIERFEQSGVSFAEALERSELRRSSDSALPPGLDGRERYPVGSTARLDLDGRAIYLVALSRSDDLLPDSAPTLALLVASLDGLWRAINEDRSGQAIATPLIGSGAYGLALDPELNVELLIRTFLDVARRQRAPAPQLHIVLSSSDVDLRQIRSDVKATSLKRLLRLPLVRTS